MEINYSTNIIFLIIIYLGKLAIEKFTTVSIEKFKYETQLENEKSMVVYSRLHSDRAKVIRELYVLLVDAVNSLISLAKPLQLAGEPKKEEKFKIVVDKYNEFLKYYEHNKIFFSSQLCIMVDDIINKLRDPILDYETFYPAWKESVEVDDRKNAHDFHKELTKAWGKIKDDIPPVKEKLENEFRSIIGVNLKK